MSEHKIERVATVGSAEQDEDDGVATEEPEENRVSHSTYPTI